jgi:hypothetical protein
MIGIRLQVHSTCQDEAGAWMAGSPHPVVRCKSNQVSWGRGRGDNLSTQWEGHQGRTMVVVGLKIVLGAFGIITL